MANDDDNDVNRDSAKKTSQETSGEYDACGAVAPMALYTKIYTKWLSKVKKKSKQT